MENKKERILELRKHPSFGVTLNPLLTVTDKDPGQPVLPDPGSTGSLAVSDIATLFGIASFPVTAWSIPPAWNAMDLNEFTGFVNLKTQQQPSYYTVYQQLLFFYNQLVQQMGEQQALSYLYQISPASPPPEWPVYRYWVIQEYLSLLIVSGNFRYYGWLNYPGWMGGPYNDPNNLPYRSINSAL